MVKFIIKPHSTIDLITNSSTEIFTSNDERDLSIIREILQELINLHNKAHESNLKFEDVFKEPVIEKVSNSLGEYYEHYNASNETKLIIENAEDNSIPYWMRDFIEQAFNAERHHI